MIRHTLPVIAACAVAAGTAHAGVFSDWNLVVAGNMTSNNHVDGSALIGGNLAGGSMVFAMHAVTSPTGDGLAVGGNIAASNVQVNNAGNLRFGGAIAGTAITNGGVKIHDNAAIALAANAMNQANAISDYLADLPANGTIDGAGNMNATPANIGGDMVAVYNLSQANIAGLGQLNLNMGAADSVIINFAGDANFNAPPNFVGGLNQNNSSRILWNFTNATSININNNFNGAILAPDATLALTGGGINGSVVVANISTQNAEIRRSLYTGHIPAPGAASLLALAGIASVRRRR